MLVRALCMSTNVGMNAFFRNRRQLWAPQTAQKRTSMPTCARVAPSNMNVQSQRRCQPLGLVFATRKTLGLHHRDKFERLPAKFCTKPEISAVLTLTVCTRFNCGLLASVDQLTLLACNAKRAPMSISVSLSQKQRRLGLCLFPQMVNLDFGCSCGLCRFFFLTLEPCPCCCCHVLCCCLVHDLCLCLCGSFEKHCCFPLSPRYSWRALKPLKPPKLATSLPFGWLEKWTSHSFSNWISLTRMSKSFVLKSSGSWHGVHPNFCRSLA